MQTILDIINNLGLDWYSLISTVANLGLGFLTIKYRRVLTVIAVSIADGKLTPEEIKNIAEEGKKVWKN